MRQLSRLSSHWPLTLLAWERELLDRTCRKLGGNGECGDRDLGVMAKSQSMRAEHQKDGDSDDKEQTVTTEHMS